MFLTGCKRKNGLAPTERNTTMDNLKFLAAFAAVALAGGAMAAPMHGAKPALPTAKVELRGSGDT